MSSINCEDLAEFAKSRGHNPGPEFNGNTKKPFLHDEFYRTSAEHLQEEMARIGLIINHFLEKSGEGLYEEDQAYQGLFISEAEVNSILQAVCSRPVSHKIIAETGAGQELKWPELEEIERSISIKKAGSLQRGIELRLHTLSELFSLTPFEVDAILIGLAPELDLRFEKLYAYLQDDVTRKLPSVGMLLDLLCLEESKLEARAFFSPSAPLLGNRLLRPGRDGADGGDADLPLLSKSFRLDGRITAFLLGSDETDPEISRFSVLVKPEKSFEDLIVPEGDRNFLFEAAKRIRSEQARLMFFFYGPEGTGKKLAAEAICRELGIPMLLSDLRAVPKNSVAETLSLVLREALLQRGAVYLENFGGGTDRSPEGQGNEASSSGPGLPGLVRELDSFPGPVFLSGEKSWEPGSALKNNTFISCAFPLPSFAERKQLWELCLKNSEHVSDEAGLEDLAARFKLSGGHIAGAVSTARGFAAARNPGKPVISREDLYKACRNRSSQKLDSLARKINPRRKWQDIVLPAAVKEQLGEICAFARHKETVYSEWGFDKKLSLGKGLNILFAGPSGTGKTLAAEIIAGEVGLDLYKIDLSGVVSKYIGETEKNLKKIFGEAETGNAILFFDEADALFGKRSEVKDSHDRYANIEVNYLLQQMEEHEGIIILASNYKKNLDDAFLRRLQFAVEFPIPDEASRREIWTGMFPEKAPLGEDLDFNFLSKFKLTGGNIKNIALLSAVLAADGPGAIGMNEALRALKREFQKMGKICTPADFGAYYELVK